MTELEAEWGVSEEEFCGAASYCEGGGRTETTVTRDYRYADRAPLFSVLRTGTGDMSLLAGRDVGMASVYGVYTAGAPSSLGAALDARFNLPRGTTSMTPCWAPSSTTASTTRRWPPTAPGTRTRAAT